MNEFVFDVLVLNDKNEVQVQSKKKIYNTDDILNLPNWCKINRIRNKEWPNGSSGLSIKESNKKSYQESIGYLVCRPGCAYVEYDSIMTIIQHEDGFIDIIPQNYLKCMTAFTAKKTFSHSNINDQDQFLVPNEQHPRFQQFQNDSIIYSLFNSSSQQTSLRNIQYHNKTWNIRNNFFWCSNSWIKTLAELYNNEQVYNDLIQYPTDPYVYTLIGSRITNRDKGTFSKTALEVLSKASHLLETTFPYRNEFNNEHPEYQVNNWDSSYYQLKPMWKKYKEKEFKEFRDLFIQFRKELEPLVYELGFLKE